MPCLDAITNPGGGCLIGGYHGITVFGGSQYFNVFIDPVTTSNDINVATLLPQTAIAQNLFIETDVAPGAGESFTVNLLQNSITTGLSVVISGASAASAHDTITRVTLTQGSHFNFETIASAGCAASWFRIGCLIQLLNL